MRPRIRYCSTPAGRVAYSQLAQDAGFSRFREVTRTPVNVVLELRA